MEFIKFETMIRFEGKKTILTCLLLMLIQIAKAQFIFAPGTTFQVRDSTRVTFFRTSDSLTILTGASLINDGMILFKSGFKVQEFPGSPIRGTGKEICYGLSSLSSQHPGTLGLEFISTTTGDSLTVIRTHASDTINGIISVARQFRLIPSDSGLRFHEILFHADTSEYSGYDPEVWHLAGIDTSFVNYGRTGSNAINLLYNDTIVPFSLYTLFPASENYLSNNTDTICPGDTLRLTIHVNGLFPSGTTWTGELSDENGSFSSPLFTGSTTGNDTLHFEIATSGFPSGSNYAFRIATPNPATEFTFQQLIIHSPVLPQITGLNSGYCIDASPVVLTPIPASVTVSGNGYNALQFDPQLAGTGDHLLYASYIDSNNCFAIDSFAVSVFDLPVTSISGLNSAYCSNDPSVSISSIPNGGIITGNGYSFPQFDPASAGAGTHQLVVDYTDTNGCYDSDTAQVIVNAAPSVNLSGLDPTYCNNALPVSLTAQPSGAQISGSGYSDPFFDPAALTPGNTSLTVSFTDTNGCSSSSDYMTEILEVPNTPVITENYDSLFCQNFIGGTIQWYFNGNLLSGENDSLLITQGNGIYLVEFTGANGCQSSAQINFQSTGISHFESTSVLRFYPNPSGGNVFFENLSNYDEWIRVFDIQGKCIEQFAINAHQRLQKSFSHSPGIYLVVAKGQTQKLIIE